MNKLSDVFLNLERERMRAEYERIKADYRRTRVQRMVEEAKNRHELIQVLTDYFGEYIPEQMDSYVYSKFPLTKLEKALR